MNIKTRLSVQFTLLVAVILIIFSLLVYYFSFTSQRLKYRENLLRRAQNTAILFTSVPDIDSTELKSIHESTFLWNEEEIVLADSALDILYSNNIDYLTRQAVKKYSPKSFYNYFSIHEKDGVCNRMKLQNHTYYSYVLAYDIRRSENLKNLREMLIWSIFISVLLSVFISYLFSKNAIHPLSVLMDKIRNIHPGNLAERLYVGHSRDEIGQLAAAFNDMLSKLERVFKDQDEFVSNVSHELRTPLAVMISETDYLLMKERAGEEYTAHLRRITGDLKKLNLLSNSLLELAQLNRTSITMSEVRVDEILQNATYEIKKKYPGHKVISKILYSENERDLVIRGNPGLLELAFKNLLDNACKFSNDEVNVEVQISDQNISIIVTDKGIGIPDGELKNIFRPFTRASNVKYFSGHGIGLSLVSKIAELHNARIRISISGIKVPGQKSYSAS